MIEPPSPVIVIGSTRVLSMVGKCSSGEFEAQGRHTWRGANKAGKIQVNANIGSLCYSSVRHRKGKHAELPLERVRISPATKPLITLYIPAFPMLEVTVKFVPSAGATLAKNKKEANNNTSALIVLSLLAKAHNNNNNKTVLLYQK